MKHESISSKIKAHHAQKYISEALEKFHSSKKLCQAHRAILKNHSISKDDCDKLKSKTSKDSYNTRRSKQNS